MSKMIHLTLWCPLCDGDIDFTDDPFKSLGKPICCPHCKATVEVAYESVYDEETQDAQGWFYLEVTAT